MTKQFDVIVIGGGPGGYVAAIRAAQRNLKTALIESCYVGGTCLNQGCIPSKNLIHHARLISQVKKASSSGISPISFDYSLMNKNKDNLVSRIRSSLKNLIASHRITLFQGTGSFISPHQVHVDAVEPVILEAKSIIIATGSTPKKLPLLPVDGIKVHDSTSLLNLTTLPQTLVIVGGGVIGCEFASLHAALGVQVTLVEQLPTLVAREGKEIGEMLASSFKRRGICVHTNSKILKVENKEKIEIELEQDKVIADMALIAIGRAYYTQGLCLDKANVELNAQGAIAINDSMQTSQPNIYAIGDVTGGWMLAHVASHQGIIAADACAGIVSTMNSQAIPSLIFTDPEIATVGYTLEQALSLGLDAIASSFPLAALGKAQAIHHPEGFAKIVASASTGLILGAQAVGAEASTWIGQMSLAISAKLTIHDVTHAIYGHPSFSEAWLEAALQMTQGALHLPPKAGS